jgi:YD repeat-containing protein
MTDNETFYNYDPNGHLIEMADRFIEVIFDAGGQP